MIRYYRVDGGALTYAEYWRLAPDPFSFLIAAAMKLLGVGPRFHFAVPRPDRLQVVDYEDLPASAKWLMDPKIQGAEDAGLRFALCHRLPLPEPHRLGAAAVLSDPTGETLLNVIFSQDGEARDCQMTCLSRFPDGTLGITTTMRKTFESPPEARIARHRGAGPADLLARHHENLDRLATEGLFPLKTDPARVADVIHDFEVRYVDYQAARGLLVPMTDDEVAALRGPGW